MAKQIKMTEKFTKTSEPMIEFNFPEHGVTISAISKEKAFEKLEVLLKTTGGEK